MAKHPNHPHSVVFYSYPKLLFAWPIIVFGLLFYVITPAIKAELAVPAPAEQAESAEPTPAADQPTQVIESAQLQPRVQHNTYLEGIGWVYIFIVTIVVLTLGVDLERNYAAFVIVAVIALLLFGSFIASKFSIPVFGVFYDFFDRLDIQYDKNLGLMLAILLAIPYLIMLLWARLNDKWRITHNEFEHYSFGRADDSLARGAKRVRSTYPDLFELLLGLSGTLIVYSASGRAELRRIPHVPLLPLRRRQINQILEFTAVHTSADEMAATDEAEEAEDDDLGAGDSGAGSRGDDKL